MANIGDLVARLRLDSSQFDAANKKAQADADATARVIERAAKRKAEAEQLAAKVIGEAVGESSLRQVAAQRAVSEASQDYRRIQQLVRQGHLDGSQAVQAEAAALQRLTLAKNEVAAASTRQAAAERVATSAAEGHTSITQMQAASASIRLAEGTGSIRAAERFVSMIPGLGAALQTVFPLVGAAAFLGMIVKIASEFQEFRNKALETANEVNRAFREMNDELATTNMQAHVTADRLEDEIAKLEKKPSNGLQTGLDEATLAATRLSHALDKDLDKLTELTKKNSIGFWAGLASNTGETKDTANLILWAKGEVDKVRAEYEPVLAAARAGGNRQNIEQTQAMYGRDMQRAYGRVDQSLVGAQDAVQRAQDFRARPHFGAATTETGSGVSYSSSADNAANLNLLRGARQTLQAEQDEIGTSLRQGNDEQRKAVLDGVKNLGDAGKRAAEVQYRAMEEELAQMKIAGNVTAKAEYDFWDARRNAFTQGSQQYAAIVRREAELAAEGARAFHEGIEKARKLTTRNTSGAAESELSRSMAENDKRIRDGQIENAKADRIRADAADALAVANARANASLAEMAVSNAAGRSITQYDAAVRLATLHTAAYGVELEALNRKAERIASARDLTEAQKREELGKLAVEGTNLQTAQAGVMFRDQAAFNRTDTSAGVGAKDALRELAEAARDSARDLREMISTTLRSLNEAILDPKRGAFREAGANIFRSGAGTLLTKGEGYLASALPFLKNSGKPDGSASNPLHVVLAGLPGVTIPSTLTNSLSKVPQMGGLSLPDLAASMLIPGFAAGGDYPGGTLAIFGEHGPELGLIGSNAHIFPAQQTRSMLNGSGGGDIHVHVNAQGAMSPAMVAGQARQAAMIGAQQGRAMAAQDQSDQRRRAIGGVRK